MSQGTEETKDIKRRYSDEDLAFFKDIILKKLHSAKEELASLANAISNSDGNGIEDTAGGYKTYEDGQDVLEKEQLATMAARQKKFIEGLEFALMRIENKTYGICRVTGNLIPKERLIAVPHATLSIEAKNKQYL